VNDQIPYLYMRHSKLNCIMPEHGNGSCNAGNPIALVKGYLSISCIRITPYCLLSLVTLFMGVPFT